MKKGEKVVAKVEGSNRGSVVGPVLPPLKPKAVSELPPPIIAVSDRTPQTARLEPPTEKHKIPSLPSLEPKTARRPKDAATSASVVGKGKPHEVGTTSSNTSLGKALVTPTVDRNQDLTPKVRRVKSTHHLEPLKEPATLPKVRSAGDVQPRHEGGEALAEIPNPPKKKKSSKGLKEAKAPQIDTKLAASYYQRALDLHVGKETSRRAEIRQEEHQQIQILLQTFSYMVTRLLEIEMEKEAEILRDREHYAARAAAQQRKDSEGFRNERRRSSVLLPSDQQSNGTKSSRRLSASNSALSATDSLLVVPSPFREKVTGHLTTERSRQVDVLDDTNLSESENRSQRSQRTTRSNGSHQSRRSTLRRASVAQRTLDEDDEVFRDDAVHVAVPAPPSSVRSELRAPPSAVTSPTPITKGDDAKSLIPLSASMSPPVPGTVKEQIKPIARGESLDMESSSNSEPRRPSGELDYKPQLPRASQVTQSVGDQLPIDINILDD